MAQAILRRTTILFVVAVLAGLALGLSLSDVGRDVTTSHSAVLAAADQSAQAESPQHVLRRLDRVDQALQRERQTLEQLRARVDELAAQTGAGRNDAAPGDDTASESQPVRQAAVAPARRALSAVPEYRVAQLAEAGLEPSLAQRMVQREAELRREMLQRQYDRLGERIRAGEDIAGTNGGSGAALSRALREEFGDAQYDRFLYASGQSNRARVLNVIPGTVAAEAGIQPGDVLLRYDGSPVFTMTDLLQAQHAGTQGESVVVDILRHDVPVQVYLPRGPLGIQAARRARVVPEGM